MRRTLLGLWLGAAIFIWSGCKQLDKADGITTNPTTGAVTQTTPNAITTASGAASLIPVYGPLIGAALALFGNAYAAFRVKQANGNTAAALGAAVATANGIGSVVSTLPADLQAKVATAINVAHDAAGVAQALQDSLQATATGHPAAAPAPSVPPAATT